MNESPEQKITDLCYRTLDELDERDILMLKSLGTEDAAEEVTYMMMDMNKEQVTETLSSILSNVIDDILNDY